MCDTLARMLHLRRGGVCEVLAAHGVKVRFVPAVKMSAGERVASAAALLGDAADSAEYRAFEKAALAQLAGKAMDPGKTCFLLVRTGAALRCVAARFHALKLWHLRMYGTAAPYAVAAVPWTRWCRPARQRASTPARDQRWQS